MRKRHLVAVFVTGLMVSAGTAENAFAACVPGTRVCVEGVEERVDELEAAAAPVIAEVDATRDTAVKTAEDTLAQVPPIVVPDASAIYMEAYNVALDTVFVTGNRVCTPPEAGSPVCITGAAGPVHDAAYPVICPEGSSPGYWRGC